MAKHPMMIQIIDKIECKKEKLFNREKLMLPYNFIKNVLFVILSITLFMSAKLVDTEENNPFDFSNATIVTTGHLTGSAKKAVDVLVEEIFNRTGIELAVQHEWPLGKQSVIVIGTLAEREKLLTYNSMSKSDLSDPGEEGFQLWTTKKDRTVCWIFGADARGLLYGVGKLLRTFHFLPEKVWLTKTIKTSETPKYKIRGHQLGYRNLNNTYDAWSVVQYDRYIRELALFGANSIELIATSNHDYKQNKLMQLSPDDMLKANSQSCSDYGLDVWLWDPIDAKELLSPDLVQQNLLRREKIFKQIIRLDEVFVPGLEHYDLPLNELFIYLGKIAELLEKYHPQAKVWVSLQNSHASSEWLELFFEKLNQKPGWLGGVVFAPWTSLSLPEVRKRLAAEIPIRRYPDIAHNRNCEYPVPNWDTAFQLTQARECTNPRPVAMKQIHNAHDEFAIGSIGYSDGINDDVNKFIWLAQEWNPETESITTLREYARFFMSEEFSEGIAQGLLAEEKNWTGSLVSNSTIPITLKQWQDMEKYASTALLVNFRFQMGLIRAYYDAFLQQRLIYEKQLQFEAEAILAQAAIIGTEKAMSKAEDIFRKAVKEPVARKLRQRCLALADSLYRSIGAQLTVEKHGANAINRGAYISTIDVPLNDVFWYVGNFKKIRNTDNQLEAINKLLNRQNPGPGGFYRNLGDPNDWRENVFPEAWATDPGTFTIPRINFGIGLPLETVSWEGMTGSVFPLAWYTLATGLYELPFKMRFDNLDFDTNYKIRVVYSGQFRSKMKLVADKKYVIHPIIETGIQPVYEFDIPKNISRDGTVILEWQCPDKERGAQVAEVWLIPKK